MNHPTTAIPRIVAAAGVSELIVTTASDVGFAIAASWPPSRNPNAAGTTVISPISPLACDNCDSSTCSGMLPDLDGEKRAAMEPVRMTMPNREYISPERIAAIPASMMRISAILQILITRVLENRSARYPAGVASRIKGNVNPASPSDSAAAGPRMGFASGTTSQRKVPSFSTVRN